MPSSQTLLNDELLSEYVGEWLRVPIYKEGHLLSPNGRDALCGRPIAYGVGVDELLLLMGEAHERKIALGDAKRAKSFEWFIEVDTRKGGKCAVCKSESKAGREVNWTAPADDTNSGDQSTLPWGWRGRLAALQSLQHEHIAVDLLRKAGLFD